MKFSRKPNVWAYTRPKNEIKLYEGHSVSIEKTFITQVNNQIQPFT